jgi:uncharacterized protein (TIGR00369 family)
MIAFKDHPIIKGYIDSNHFGRFLGMDFEIISPGQVRYMMKVQELHLATPFAAHGGTTASLLDATLGVAALSCVCENELVVSTVEMNIHYISPAYLNDQLIAVSNVLSKGKCLLVVEGKIHDKKGRLIASGTGTFNAYPKEKAGII